MKINIQDRAESDPDTELTVADIQEWEEKHGAIPHNAIVILHTGFGRYYGDKQKYFGRPAELTLPEDDTAHLHFPGVSHGAARWLVDNRNISGSTQYHSIPCMFIII